MSRKTIGMKLCLGVVLIAWGSVAAFGVPAQHRERRPDTVTYKWKSQMTEQERQALAAVLVEYKLGLDKKIAGGSIIRVKAKRGMGVSEETLAAALMQSGGVEWAEPDYVVEAVVIPNDPYYFSQWWHQNIASAGAWDITTGVTQIVVAVCDTGVDLTHPDLVRNLILPGWNTYLNNTNCVDTYGHGTAVAGCAAATGNNGIGVAGMAWNVKILPIRITYQDGIGSAYITDIADGIAYGADRSAKVVNVSFGGYSYSTIITAADYARSKGALVVFAAGNDGLDLTGSADPASILLVGATSSFDARASFSNYGAPIDVVAPGESVLTCVMGGSYGYWSGTSFSAPITAGLAALIFSINPSFTPAQVETLITSSCKDLGVIGNDSVYGFGLIQAAGAVVKAKAAVVNLLPVAKATATPTSGSLPLVVALDGSQSSDSDGIIASYVWSFGDGSASVTGKTISHIYSTAGSFMAVLTVTDDKGATSTSSVAITVTDPAVLVAPSALAVTVVSRTVTLKWADNSSNETGFYIERAVKARTGIGPYSRVGTVGANIRAYSETVLANTYYYRVQAFNATRLSTYSNVISVRVK
jgi:thermitase